MLFVGCLLLVVVSWLLFVGCCLLFVALRLRSGQGCWLLLVGCCWLIVGFYTDFKITLLL